MWIEILRGPLHPSEPVKELFEQGVPIEGSWQREQAERPGQIIELDLDGNFNAMCG